MKNIFLTLLLAFVTNTAFGQGDAPPLLRGQGQTTKTVGATIELPNNLVTKTAPGVALIENGNNNLLGNPSFEASTFGTFWTLASGTTSLETTTVIHGKKSLKVTLASQTLNLTQDSTLYASQFAGSVQGLAMVRVKTTVSGVKLCARQAGVTSTSLCVSSQGSGNWELLKVPFILGTTSNGLAIVTTSSATGDVYVDDAFVGAVDLKQDAVKFESQSSYIIQNASFGAVTITGANTFTSGSNALYSYDSGTGIYTALKSANIHITASMTASTPPVSPAILKNDTIVQNTESANAAGYSGGVAANFTVVAGDTFKVYNLGGVSSSQKITVIATIAGNSSVYSSTNADTGWVTCTIGTVVGITPSSSAFQCKRSGEDLLLKGIITSSGAGTATEFRLGLPSWNGVQLTTKGTSVIPTTQVLGHAAFNASTTSFMMLVDPSVTYLNVGQQIATGSGPFTKIQGSTFGTSSQLAFGPIRIPIEGWENSNVIIGQFNGLETCTDSYECEDSFSAKISATAVQSDEKLPWISSVANPTAGNFTINLRSGLVGNGQSLTKVMNCNCNADVTTQAADFGCTIDTANSTTTQIKYYTTSAGTLQNRGVVISCEKNGADYIGKTAKAVASDQNNRTTGAINVENFTVTYGTTNASTICSASPCSYLDQIGSVVTSITRSSAGSYVLNLSKTYSKLKCSLTAYGSGASAVPYNTGAGLACSNCNLMNFGTVRTSTEGFIDTFGTLYCQGQN